MVVHRFATAQDTAALTAVWQRSFPEDTPHEIAAFLDKVRLDEECLIAEENGTVASMAFLLPTRLQAPTPLPMQYIYAAATLPSHRGRGLFGGLLKRALAVARERGQAASFLHPAQPSLIDYYASFGYRPFFFCDTVCGDAASNGATVRSVSADEYAKRRNDRLPPFGVEWPSRFLEHTVMVDDACAVCVATGERLLIRELFCDPAQQNRVCAALAAHFGCTRYEARLPAKEAHDPPFGLLCPLQPLELSVTAPPYMGVALD